MSNKETGLEKIIDRVDKQFNNRAWIRYQRVQVMIPRFVLAIAGFGLIGLAYYYSRVALSAAIANLLDLSVALQSLTVSILAVVFSIVALVENEESKRAENSRFQGRVFGKLKADSDPVVLHALIGMKMTLPKGILLGDTYRVNPELFARRELVRRLLE